MWVFPPLSGNDNNNNNYSSLLQSKLNSNRYATKKTIAQGMLDIALLSSNAAQLKYILTVSDLLTSWHLDWLVFIVQVGEDHQYYLPMLVLIVSSIVLQVSGSWTIVNKIISTKNYQGFEWFDPSDNGSAQSGQGGI